MASLKEFMANISGASADIKNKIIRVIGKTVWEDEPSIDLEKTSTQITAITGESGPLVLPQISLKVVDTHIKKVVGGGTTLYGITDWGSAPASLGSSAATGSATTIARGDHVHPYPTPAQIGAMATNHAANPITGFGTTAQNLNTTGSGGSATTVSRSDHVHQFPTASQVGALASNHPSAAITGLSVDTPQPLDVTPHPGNSTTVSRSNHMHAMPTAAQVGAMATNHAANSITGFGKTVNALGSSASAGQTTTVSRSDHVHPYPSPANIGAATASHTHSTYALLAGSTSQDFTANNITTVAGYIQRYSGGATLASITFGNTTNRMTFRNTAGFNFQTLSSAWASVDCGAITYSSQALRSDPYLKKNIIRGWESPTDVNIQEFAYNAVLTYHLKEDPDDSPMRHGFDAKLIRDYSPRASVILSEKDSDGNDLYGIDPVAIIAYLTQVIAEQDRRIEKLESKINK